MKTILVVPGSIGEHGVHLEDKFDFPVESLALAYLAGALRQRGLEYDIVDGYAHRLTWQQAADAVLEHAAGASRAIIGISVLQSTAKAVRKTVAGIRAAGCDAPVVLGGWFTSPDPLRLLEYIPGANFLIQGEAEISFVDLVERLRDERSLTGTPGLIHRGTDGAPLVETLASPPDLDRLAFPSHYLDYRSDQLRSPVPIQSSRGCYWGACSFCSTTERYKPRTWRMRSAESMVAELEQAVDTTGSRNFCFVDDEFFGPCEPGFERAAAFARACLERDLKFSFAIDCRIGDIRPRLFEQLKAAGLRKAFIGVEAGNATSLKTLAKGYRPGDIVRDLRYLADLEIEVQTGFITFDPYMTLQDVRTNVRFLQQELRHDGNPGKYLLKLHPDFKTPIWNRLQADGLLRGEFPEWEFQFQDPLVERLYRILQTESAGLRSRYLKDGLYRAASPEQLTERRRLNESFLRLFDDVYRSVARSGSSA